MGGVYKAMAGFSGAVKLGDLNDFINPAQACVVALSGAPLAVFICDSAGQDLPTFTHPLRV